MLENDKELKLFINELSENLNVKKDLIHSKHIIEKYKEKLTLYCKNNLISENKRNILYSNSNFEIILIKWFPNSESNIHNHSENGCIMFLIDGKIIEKRFSKNNTKTTLINNNKILYINNKDSVHQIINLDKISYSLHIYSPSGYICKEYKLNL